jgi:hypothetical protein
MRNSFDGLYALARHGLQQDPLNGQLFAFVNRRATQMRVLYWGSSRNRVGEFRHFQDASEFLVLSF